MINETEVCNYADDTTLYTCDVYLSTLMYKLELDTMKAIDWFNYNSMKLNVDKCHLLLYEHKYELMIGNVDNNFIIESQKVKLLGIEIDSDLKFKDHINSICDTVSKKINALSRQCNVLPFNRRKHLMQAFFYSPFSYCPLVWMFCNQNQNSRINKLHHRGH